MPRPLYSSRAKSASLTVVDLHKRLAHLYLLFRDRDFFKEKAGITRADLPEVIKHKAAARLRLRGEPFPIERWAPVDKTEDNVFDAIEFLHDHVSKPVYLEWKKDYETGQQYEDYGEYDEAAGQKEFRDEASGFLADYKTGFELAKGGKVLAMGTGGLQPLLDAEIIPYDEENVDSRVRNAIVKWRNRHLSLSDRKDAIRELADVFEWLKKNRCLDNVLDRKDESAIFEIANQFAIRHHNPAQRKDYDQDIWYSWMFHLYLATYHACVRMLKRKG